MEIAVVALSMVSVFVSLFYSLALRRIKELERDVEWARKEMWEQTNKAHKYALELEQMKANTKTRMKLYEDK